MSDADLRNLWSSAQDLVEHGQWPEAVNVFDGLLRLAPGDTRALYNKALSHWYCGELAVAQSCLQEVLEKRPGYELAECALARLSKDILEYETSPRLSVEDVVLSVFGKVSSPRLFLTPAIPNERIYAAEEAYAGDLDGERVLALYDDVYFTRGSRGLIISDKRLIWKGARQKNSTTLDLGNIGALSVDNRVISILTRSLEEHHIRLSRANRAEIEVIWFALRSISHVAMSRIPSALRNVANYRRAVSEAIIQTLQSNNDGSAYTMFIAPNIPDDRVELAWQTFLDLEDNERLLALYDDTILANARAGYYITDRRIVWCKGQDIGSVEMENVQAAERLEEGVLLTSNHSNRLLNMTLWSKCQAEGLALALLRVAELNRSKRMGQIDSPTVLRSSSVRLLSVELNRLHPQIPGTLTLCEDALLWRPEDVDELNWIRTENISVVRAEPFSQRITVESKVGPVAVRFDVGEGGPAWVKAIENARASRMMTRYFGNF